MEIPDEDKEDPPRYIKDMLKERSQLEHRDRPLTSYYRNNLTNNPEVFPFTSHFTRRLLHNKHVVVIGDSLSRAIYKDLVGLLTDDRLLDDQVFRRKWEFSHRGDRLIEDVPMAQDKVWRQAREYQTNSHLIQFFFTTRVMKEDMDRFILSFVDRGEYPDVILINSALWDITRYNLYNVDMLSVAPYENCPQKQLKNELHGMDEYLNRLAALMRRFRVILPPTTQVIWMCMPYVLPEAVNAGKGFLGRYGVAKLRPLQRSLYCDANYRAAQVVREAGYDVLDLGFSMRNHALYTFRTTDGVHWDSVGTRLMTQLVIGRLSMNVPLPKDIQERLAKYRNSCPNFGAEFQLHINQKVSSGRKPSADPEETEALSGSHPEPLFRELSQLTLEKLADGLRTAILEDIGRMRAVNLLRTESLSLSETDAERLSTMVTNPAVVSHIKGEVPVQRVILEPKKTRSRPRSRGTAAQSTAVNGAATSNTSN